MIVSSLQLTYSGAENLSGLPCSVYLTCNRLRFYLLFRWDFSPFVPDLFTSETNPVTILVRVFQPYFTLFTITELTIVHLC
jgi:hypothetical protein